STDAQGGGRDSAQTAAGSVARGEWVHVAAVFDRTNGQQRLYINGEPTVTEAMRTTVAQGTDAPLRIGWSREIDASYGAFDGAVDEVRLWSTARGDAEILADFASALAGDETDLKLYLPLDSVAEEGTLSDAGPDMHPASRINMIPQGITGEIDAVGKRFDYTFTLDGERRIYIDSLTPAAGLQYSLRGPQGVLVSQDLDQADKTGNPVLSLPPGDYTLRVQGDGSTTGMFNLVLLDLGAAKELTLGSPI
ncbi:LamG domain-containing protein, partial [Cribrihabitans sp. XS_ASV171]